VKTTTNRKQCQIGRAVVILVALALGVVIAGCPGSPPAYSAEIRTWHDLDAVRYHLDKSFTLMNDLDADTAGYGRLAGPRANRGMGWLPIGAGALSPDSVVFKGSFDGQGYEIRDLFINRPDENQVGLFYFPFDQGTIENLGLTEVTVTGGRYVGALAGRNYGVVSNCYSSGSVTGKSWTVGGLVGDNQGTVISSHSTASVTGGWLVGGLVGSNSGGSVTGSYSTGSVTGGDTAGGLVGSNSGGTVRKSYFTGSVSGNDDVGGLVGKNRGTVDNCYSTGSVSGNWYVGGLVGYNESWGAVINSYCSGSVTGGDFEVGGLVGASESGASATNSFWDVETSGMEGSDGGTGKTTGEMMNVVTFTDTQAEGLDDPWDIIIVAANVTDPAYTWNIVDGDTYPFLVWQSVD
jgi:trimeric autotransporter adhesin